MHYREWVVSAGRPSTDARQTLRRAGMLVFSDNDTLKGKGKMSP